MGGTTTRFLYDGEQLIAETDSSGALTAKYVFGAGLDEPLRLERAGTFTYYHADGLGSIVALTDGSGAVLERYQYDAFSQTQITDPAGAVRASSIVTNRFAFTARELDAETGLYHYRARSYSPSLGRFLQRDPLGYGPDVNLYRYVGNNPINWVDPWGWYSPITQQGPIIIGHPGGLIGPTIFNHPVSDPSPTFAPHPGELQGPTINVTPIAGPGPIFDSLKVPKPIRVIIILGGIILGPLTGPIEGIPGTGGPIAPKPKPPIVLPSPGGEEGEKGSGAGGKDKDSDSGKDKSETFQPPKKGTVLF